MLDKADRRILFELDKNARIPDTKLAKLVGKSKESIRYRIQQLKKKGIIKGFTIWIDPTKLNYQTAKIYLTLANKPKLKEEFIDFVKSDKRIFWLGIAEGAWNAGMTYFIKNNRELFELKNELFSRFKDLILDSRVLSIVDINVHDKTFLFNTDTRWKPMFDRQEHFILDKIEIKILQELFNNARTSIVEIARKTDSSVDIIRNRIKRLEKRKIIFRYMCITDFNKLGYEFYKTFIYFTNLSKKDESRLMEYARKNPKTIHSVRTFGPWDFELEIMCDSYHDYINIINNLTKEFSDIINKVETAIMGEDYVFPAKRLVFE
jgi:DNA-binding Lrp family transcriptional regulator